ncbi:uncharacterized protein LOC134268785 isoform X2 [Saccostrea cucullata]|uniref:uncharacterized protein LOC134268785 isoform X2 n=1 Tax=Saccostrea cuccullata TaxID=36930 RepID=UPI002ED36589
MFLSNRDNIGPLCFSSIILGIMIGFGLMYLHERYKTKKNESIKRQSFSNRTYGDLLPVEPRGDGYEGIQRTRQRNLNPRAANQDESYTNVIDNYLDPISYKDQADYLTPLHNVSNSALR